jgi:peptidoglycan/LPS O-acetylase OafA/YrhL
VSRTAADDVVLATCAAVLVPISAKKIAAHEPLQFRRELTYRYNTARAHPSGMSPARARIPELDGLRGLAIAAVMCFHSALYFPIAGATRSLFLFGWSGVDLFFVISGFLIGGILVDQREAGNYFSAFYLRRFFRIVPVYFAVLAAYGFAWSMDGAIRPTLAGAVGSPMHWYTYLSITNNFQIAKQDSMGFFLPVSWSLAIEEQFYLTLPLLVWLVAPKHFPKVVGTLIVAVVLLRASSCWYEVVTQNQAYVLPWFRADALLMGVGCALLVRNNRAVEWMRSHRALLLGALGVFGLAVIVTGTHLPHWTASPKSPLMTVGLTFVALMYAALLLFSIVHPPAALSRALSLRPLQWIGKVSYCVYLVHQVAFAAATVLILPSLEQWFPRGAPWITLFAALAAIILIAQISWVILERRMIRVGHRFDFEPKPEMGQPALTLVPQGATQLRAAEE